jgi:hypothetical protein
MPVLLTRLSFPRVLAAFSVLAAIAVLVLAALAPRIDSQQAPRVGVAPERAVR